MRRPLRFAHATLSRAVLGLASALLGAGAGMSDTGRAAPPAIAGASLRPLAYAELPGWHEDDHAAAFATFRRSCQAILRDEPALRSGQPTPPALRSACAEAVKLGSPSPVEARLFFERAFVPYAVQPSGNASSGSGFLTGYFEPQLPGSPQPAGGMTAPLLARPDDLVSWPLGERPADAPEGCDAARRQGARLLPYPTRAEIEDGALGAAAKPLVYLDPVDAFTVHVQGSAAIVLPDGRTVRVAYAGKNGRPYTSAGKLAVAEGHLALEQATADRLYAFMKREPAVGRELMRRNASYIFFRLADELDPALGPVGAASVQLTAGRSAAVDRHLWPYGLPMFLGADLSDIPDGSPTRRLVVAQDTGSAILGPARADLFVGSGEAAGVAAGRIRHALDLVVLWPRGESAPHPRRAGP